MLRGLCAVLLISEVCKVVVDAAVTAVVVADVSSYQNSLAPAAPRVPGLSGTS